MAEKKGAPDMARTVPYHEWLLNAIRNASWVGLHELAPMVKKITIPKGHHDETIDAWRERMERLGLMKDDLGVPAALREQKAEAETEDQKESAGISAEIEAYAYRLADG
ncbi:MAG: hypothetical protein WCW47_01685 [Candidatus Paceibacterota bacterium]